VIYDSDSGRIYFDQDGSGSVYDQVEIGKVNAGIASFLRLHRRQRLVPLD
jgi:hypothetical protein